MSEATPFIELTPAYRVLAVEEVRQRLYELARKAGHSLSDDPPLTPEATAWLKRMRSALCDTEVTNYSIAEVDAAMHEALPEAEDSEVHRRLCEFELIRDAIPHGATKPSAAVLRAVLEGLLRKAEV
jgi:hypothetical protein